MQTAINTSFGVLVGTGLWFIGVPNPATLGHPHDAAALRPYIGPVIAAAFPAIVALAVDPGMGDAVLGGGSVPRRRARHRSGDRALAVRPQYRAFGRRGCRCRRFLDTALGTGWTATIDATDDVPRCAGPACRAFTVSRGASRRPACTGAGGSLLSAHARRRIPTKPRIRPKRFSRPNLCRPITTKSRSAGSLWLSSTSIGCAGTRAPGKDQRSGRMGHRRSCRPRRARSPAQEEGSGGVAAAAGSLSRGTRRPLAGERPCCASPAADRSTRRLRQCWHSFWKNTELVRAWCRPKQFR